MVFDLLNVTSLTQAEVVLLTSAYFATSWMGWVFLLFALLIGQGRLFAKVGFPYAYVVSNRNIKIWFLCNVTYALFSSDYGALDLILIPITTYQLLIYIVMSNVLHRTGISGTATLPLLGTLILIGKL